MWVTMEIPHPEVAQPPRTVRGRVAWIQRPRPVRQLFQVALELEVAGNVWCIAFPPEDWTAVPELTQVVLKLDAAQETPQLPPPVTETDAAAPLGEAELPLAAGAANLRVFPSPASTTDASLQLARQVARLVADAKKQIQAATREAASEAGSAERRLSFEQWEQKCAAGRAEIENETVQAVEKFQLETDERSRTAHAAAAEALRTELPRWLGPQLEQLTRELTTSLAREGAVQRNEHAQQLESVTDALRKAAQQGEYAATRLKTRAEQTQTQIAAQAESATRALEEAARQHEQHATAQREALLAAANEIQQQVTAALASAQSSLQAQLVSELEAAQTRWRTAIESTLAEVQDRAAGGLNLHARGWMDQLQDEISRHAAAARESAANTALETEQRIATLRDALQEQTQRLDAVLAVAGATIQRLAQPSDQLAKVQQPTFAGFPPHIHKQLSPHREE